MELRLQPLPESERDVRVLRRVANCIPHVHLVKGDGRLAGSQERLDRNRRVLKVALGKPIHPMPVQPGVQGIGDQHRIVRRGYPDAVARKNLRIVFHVLADFQDRGIFQDRLQCRQCPFHRQLVFGQLVGRE